MNVEKRTKIIVDWINSYCENAVFEPKSLVVGISGGIDSSVVSTICSLTNRKTIVLSMPIKQIKSQHDLSIEHGNWLTNKFKNVEHKTIELEDLFKNFEKTLGEYKNEHGFSDATASTIPPTRAHSYKKVPEIVRDRRETACAYVQAPQCGTLFSGCV